MLGATHQDEPDYDFGDFCEVDDIVQQAQMANFVTNTDSDLSKLAQTAANLEHSHHSFTVDDLTSLLSHFTTIDKVSNDGTLTQKEFAQCFAMLGVHGFLVDVLFEAFTWDNEIGVTHINIKDFLCGFILLVIGKAEDKLRITFELHDQEHTGYCGIEKLYEIFRCFHMVLARMSKQFPRNSQRFTNEMMLIIHDVASEGGKPVRRVTLEQFVSACRRQSYLFSCLTSMEEPQGPHRSVNEMYKRRESLEHNPLLKGRSKRYKRAGQRGIRRFCPCVPRNNRVSRFSKRHKKQQKVAFQASDDEEDFDAIERLTSEIYPTSSFVATTKSSSAATTTATPNTATAATTKSSSSSTPTKKNNKTAPNTTATTQTKSQTSDLNVSGVTVGSTDPGSPSATYHIDTMEIGNSCDLEPESSISEATALKIAKSLKAGLKREVVLDWLLARESWHLMISFLLAVKRSTERMALQDIQLVPESFTRARIINVPAHNPSTISFTMEVVDYAPAVFQHIRRMYNINDAEYVRSLSPLPILGNLLLGNLRSLSSLVSEGKSGSLLYFSEDNRYVIKTITTRERKIFLRILQSYYDYIRSNPHTLIIRYFGLFDLHLPGRVITLTVMANVFDTPLSISRRYDLKGSTVGRSALKGKPPSHRLSTVCFKDNDLSFKFLVPLQVRRDLVVQLACDANWLASHGLIDYSLIIGVHNVPEGSVQDTLANVPPPRRLWMDPDEEYSDSDSVDSNSPATPTKKNTKPQQQQQQQQEPQSQPQAAKFNTPTKPPRRNSASSPPSSPSQPQQRPTMSVTGVNSATAPPPLPPRAATPLYTPPVSLATVPGLDDEGWRWRSRFQSHKGGIRCATSSGADLGPSCVICVGIIDCFTYYGPRKRVERAGKVMTGADRNGVSVMSPSPYARRFINFACENVFGDSHPLDGSNVPQNLAQQQQPQQQQGKNTEDTLQDVVL